MSHRDPQAPRTTCEHCACAIAWDYGTHRWLRTSSKRDRGVCKGSREHGHEPARINANA